MKTDTIFYQLLQKFPWIFFQLIQREEIDVAADEFIAPEIKQRSFRLDGLFTTTEENSNLPLYQEAALREPEWFAIVIFEPKSHDVDIQTR